MTNILVDIRDSSGQSLNGSLRVTLAYIYPTNSDGTFIVPVTETYKTDRGAFEITLLADTVYTFEVVRSSPAKVLSSFKATIPASNTVVPLIDLVPIDPADTLEAVKRQTLINQLRADSLLLSGAKGDLGPIGPIGPVGPVGPIGPPGEPGLQGTSGIQGIQGIKGDKGDLGSPGVQGLKGDTGPLGSKGDKGDQGDQGATGSPGATTINGIDGLQTALDTKAPTNNPVFTTRVAIDATGATAGNPRVFGFNNVPNGGTTRFELDGGFNCWQGGKGGRQQFVSWHGIEFYGATAAGNISVRSGSGSNDDCVSIITNNSLTPFSVKTLGNTKLFTIDSQGIPRPGSNPSDRYALVSELPASVPVTTKGDLLTHNGTTSVRVPVGTNGLVLMADSAAANGLKWDVVPAGAKGDTGIQGIKGDKGDTGIQGIQGTAGSVNTPTYQSYFDDFLSTTNAQFMFTSAATSGGNLFTVSAPTTDSCGVLRLNTGTSATGRATILTNFALAAGGHLDVDMTIRARMVNLNATGNTALFRCGLQSHTSSNPVDGLYFIYDSTSLNWQLQLMINNVATNVDTGVVADGSWAKFNIAITNSQLTASINGTSVLVPSGSLSGSFVRYAVASNLVKTLGTTNIAADVDYFQLNLNWKVTR